MQRMFRAAALAAVLTLIAGLAGAAEPPARATQLIGGGVLNPAGEYVGELVDLVVDMQERRAVFAVLSVGGYLGVGDRLVALPVPSPELSLRDGRLRLDATRRRLAAMRGFRSTEWPDFDAVRAGAPAGEPRHVRASKLLGSDLLDRRGADVGDVRDFLVDLHDGKLANAVVEFIPSWFRAGELVALPMTSLSHRGAAFVAEFEAADMRPAEEARKAAQAPPAPPPRAPLDRALRASRVIGMPVVDAQGNEVARVQDIVLEPVAHRATHLLLAPGGAGGKVVALALPPPRNASLKDGRLALEMNRDALLALPPHGAPPAGTVRASLALKAQVSNPEGKEVGKVEEIVVNLGEARINYAVAAFDPNWVQEGKLVAVPLRELKPAEGGRLAMQYRLNELNRAYFFDKGSWPDLNDRSLLATMERYVN